MVLWLRPQCILAIVTSLYSCSLVVSGKSYEKFYCSTEEGHHHITCPDDTALLTDVSIRKIYRRTQMCEPDVHSDYLVHCQGLVDGSVCEGNKTCSIEVSSRNYVQCGEKTYSPTYFFVRYTCIQIHTMCVDTAPIRNTLYGFIVSPAYPHPMADNLKCSINIEADPSMNLEVTPIQIRLQEAVKCRSEYLEIFGYINSVSTNSSSDEMSSSDRNAQNIWKSYQTWCGSDRSTNHPSAHARYLISSNSLYMSLQTAVSKKPRYFKIRYKVIPATKRPEYDPDGIAYDPSFEASKSSMMMTATTSTVVMSTTIVMPTLDDSPTRPVNGTAAKRPFRKEILIGIVAGVIVLILAVLLGIGIFLFLKRRRASTPASTSAGKKVAAPPPSTTTTTAAVSKAAIKSPDRAPLLDKTNNDANPAAVKRKLVPERTVQIADVNTSRFKAGAAPSAIGKTAGTGKETSSTSSEAVVASAVPAPVKAALNAADSGIYGADFSDDAPSTVSKSVLSSSPPKIYGLDLPDKSAPADPVPSVTVVVNPLSEEATIPTESTMVVAAAVVATVVPLSLPSDTMDEAQTPVEHIDDTVRSAYLNLIDATISENEGTVCSGSVVSSASQSRRTSFVKQPFLSHETNSIDLKPRRTTQFNPLHVILKKDANKYYTTEYI